MGSQVHTENDQQNGICVNALLIVVADMYIEIFTYFSSQHPLCIRKLRASLLKLCLKTH